MAKNADNIKEMAQPLIEPGEEVLAAMAAAPRGNTTAKATGGAARWIGQAKVGHVHENAKAVGIVLSSPMAVVITQKRLLTLKIKVSAMGAVTEVVEVMSAVPLVDVESIEAKRFGLAGVLTITARGGEPIKLETPRPGVARELADAFDKAKANS